MAFGILPATLRRLLSLWSIFSDRMTALFKYFSLTRLTSWPTWDVESGPQANLKVESSQERENVNTTLPALYTAPVTWDKNLPEKDDPYTAYTNETNIDALTNESNIYKRLGQHEGILECFQTAKHSIELAFANQGDLTKYIENNTQPAEHVRADWIRRLADSFAYAHSRRVVVDDIHTGNILLHNNCPKLSDFNQSFLLPLDTEMEGFSANSTSPEIEILHLGCVFYSIAVWSKFKYDYFHYERWPNPDDLPNTHGILGGTIIRKCWTRGYASMELLRKDVEASLS